jgi:hypothetical protein
MGKFQVKGEFVDLVIDGENLGVYYLMKTMEINKQTIDLRDVMGVLVELDNVYCGAEDRRYIANNGDCFTVKDIVTKDSEKEVMEDFVKQYNDFLNALKKRDYETINKLVDIESFAKYFIISELTANPDAYVTSWFLYKDGFGDRIHAGLAWDFDAAFGNRNWGDWPDGFYLPTAILNRLEYTYGKNEVNKICGYDKSRVLKETVDVSLAMCQFLDVPEFREVVGIVYRENIVGKENEIIEYIDMRANELREAAKRDAVLWEKGDFDEEVEYLKWWMWERLKYFEETYAGYFVESKTT